MLISLLCLPLTLAANYQLVVVWGWHYIGAAAAMSAAAAFELLLLLLYVAASGSWPWVIGVPSYRALKVGTAHSCAQPSGCGQHWHRRTCCVCTIGDLAGAITWTPR